MKLKKYFSVLLIVAVILIPSASAFAEESNINTEVTPYVVGIGDSQANAISLILSGGVVGGVVYDLFIQDQTEQDWFKWTNTSTSFKRIVAHIGGYSGNGPTRAGLLIVHGGLADTGVLYTGKAGTSETQSFDNVFVPPGSTVYVVVDAPNITTPSAYHLNFAAYDY